MKLLEFQKTDKSPAMAAILSCIFLGLGQAYNKETTKAVFFVILYAVSIFLTFFIIGFLTTPILWIWSVVDAYRSSQRINQVGNARESSPNAPPSGLVMNVHVSD